MRRFGLALLAGTAVSVFLTGAGVVAAHSPKTLDHDAITACSTMMKSQGMTEEAQGAMREYMQFDRGRGTTSGMMEMARRMGNGVMTSIGQMMGQMEMMGPGGMMSPRQPSERR